MQSYPSLVFYIHKPTLAKHVRHAKPLHQWCKKEVVFSNGTIYIAPEQQQGNPSSLSQFSIDAGIATSSYTYFEKLFRSFISSRRGNCSYKTKKFNNSPNEKWVKIWVNR